MPAPRLTPINMAKAISDPLWDPQLSGLGDWEVTVNAPTEDGRSVTIRSDRKGVGR